MNRRSITIVVMVVLCAAGFAYGQGWLHRSPTGAAIEGNKVGAHQTLDQEKMQGGAVPATQQTDPATATK